MRHLTASVYAIFDKPVRMYRGETMAGHIEDEAPNDPSRGFVGGYYLQLLVARACRSWPRSWTRARGAATSPRALEAYENMAGMWLVGEDMPQETNRVTLNRDELDQHGQPVPNVHFDDHPNDLAMREHAWAAGEALYESVGAVRTIRTPPYPATHNIGTARMSERPEDGVVNAFGQAHDVPEPVRLRRQPVHDGRGREPDADDRRARHPAGRVHRRAAASRARSRPATPSWDGRDPGGSVAEPAVAAGTEAT